jgi:hypothetical protein
MTHALRFTRWSHCFNSQLLGLNNQIIVSAPIWRLETGDSLIIHSAVFNPRGREIEIKAEIIEASKPREPLRDWEEVRHLRF